MPSLLTCDPGRLRHANVSFGTFLVISASHDTATPPGPSATQCERPSPKSCTSFKWDMKRGKFAYCDQNENTASTGASTCTTFSNSMACGPGPAPTIWRQS